MATVLKMVDESPGSGREPRPVFELRLVSERITVRELIQRRVEREVAEYNRRPGKVFSGLVQPTGAERELNGYRLKRPRPLDVEKQVRVAVEAFEKGAFFLLFDDRQAESLDEELVLGEKSVASFVQLVPLVGG